MNNSAFWRLVWKEYRLQRSLWFAMTALAATATLLVFKFVAFNADIRAPDQLQWLFMVALGFPAFYLLGCGATLFAGEREARTYEFQRGLPVAARRVFAVKIAFAVMSAAVMFGLMWLLAGCLSCGLPASPADSAPNPALLAALMACFGLEMFLWATLFSLLSSRVLLAAVLGVAAASVSTELLGNLYNVMHGDLATLPVIAVITVLVALADLRLGARWFADRRDRRPRPARPKPAAAPRVLAVGSQDQIGGPRRGAMVIRLVWQHWRESRALLVTLSALLIPLIVLGVLRLCGDPQFYRINYFKEDGAVLGLLAFADPALALACASLVGACVFLADQRGRSRRFLAERGVPAKYVWLGRQSLAALLLATYAAIAALAVVLFSGRVQFGSPDGGGRSAIMGQAFGYALLGIAVGQFGSMLFQSGIMAGLFSAVLTCVLAAWCWLMSYLQVSWWWSALPIPLALLLATRLRRRTG